jgi:hypothetical protein
MNEHEVQREGRVSLKLKLKGGLKLIIPPKNVVFVEIRCVGKRMKFGPEGHVVARLANEMIFSSITLRPQSPIYYIRERIPWYDFVEMRRHPRPEDLVL